MDIASAGEGALSGVSFLKIANGGKAKYSVAISYGTCQVHRQLSEVAILGVDESLLLLKLSTRIDAANRTPFGRSELGSMG